MFGYFIEVSKSQLSRVPEEYHRKQTLVNAERFITPELKEYESKVLSAGDRISELERELFSQLRAEVAEKVLEIQQFSRADRGNRCAPCVRPCRARTPVRPNR